MARHARARDAARQQLEQLGRENDALEAENARLLREAADRDRELARLRDALSAAEAKLAAGDASANTFEAAGASGRSSDTAGALLKELLVSSNNSFPPESLRVVPLGASNPLCVSACARRRRLVFTGSAAKEVALLDWTRDGLAVARVQVSGPVLSVRPFPRLPGSEAIYVLASCMDGACHFLQFLLPDSDAGPGVGRVVLSWRDHDSYVLDARTQLCNGEGVGDQESGVAAFFRCVTVSRDKSCVVSQLRRVAGGGGGTSTTTFKRVKLQSFFFANCVESVAFVGPPIAASMGSGITASDDLVVATRGSCFLTFCDVAANTRHEWNMNERGDTHVSFNVLRLEASPCGRFLLVVTDAHRHFVVGGGAVLRNFYGHTADGMSTPRAVWHPSRQFVLGNSQKDCDAHVWCVASERTRTCLQGHRRAVRDLAHHPEANLLFSVSYDKTLRVWKTGDGDEANTDVGVKAPPAAPAAAAPAAAAPAAAAPAAAASATE